jgi:hypothetical protein
MNNVTKIVIVSARDPRVIKEKVEKIKASHKHGKISLIEF